MMDPRRVIGLYLQAPERLYQGGSTLVDFFGMSWRQGGAFNPVEYV